MKQYLIDTDILIDYYKGKDPVRSELLQLFQTSECAVSIISYAEFGVGLNEQVRQKVYDTLQQLIYIEYIDFEIAEKAAEYRRVYKSKGHNLDLLDMFIAATAVTKEYTLVTRNVKDYPMPEIELYTF